MLFPHLTTAVPSPTSSGPVRWLRRLAGPAAGLLVVSLAAGLTTGTAFAVSSGTLSVAPSAGAVVPLETSRLSSQTVLDLAVPATAPFYAAIQLRSADSGSIGTPWSGPTSETSKLPTPFSSVRTRFASKPGSPARNLFSAG